jgi:hypothetical protein
MFHFSSQILEHRKRVSVQLIARRRFSSKRESMPVAASTATRTMASRGPKREHAVHRQFSPEMDANKSFVLNFL